MISEFEKKALEKILDSGNKQKCFEFFRGMPEKNRREYFAVVKPFWSRVRKLRFIEDPPNTYSLNPLDPISRLAYFATASGSEIIKAKRTGYPDSEFAFEVIADRRPDWVDQWIEMLLGESYYWNHWRLIRKLIVAKIATKPTNPRYFLGMIGGINNRHGKVNLEGELEKHPDLLKEDVWKLFEYDGDSENSLANTERFERSWMEAFLSLSKRGKLPRAKLIEACISALERDFNHYRAKWFYEFFDRLEPSEKELQKLGERILGLLGVSAPNVASWALNRVEALANSAGLETLSLCHSLEPLLRARAKGTVLAALKLLERQAVKYPKEASVIAATAVQALGHDATDVQKATLSLLDSIASPQDERIRSTVAKLHPHLSASVRALAAKWMAKDGPKQPDKNTQSSPSKKPIGAIDPAAKLPKLPKHVESLYAIDQLRNNLKSNVLSIPAAVFDGTDIPRLVQQTPITAIEGMEELVDVCARVIEDGSLVDDAERCIDGLARLVNSKPTNFDQITAPLLKRVRKLIAKGSCPFCGVDPGNDILGLFYAFCTGTVVEPKLKGKELCMQFEGKEIREYGVNAIKPIGFLSAHCLEVARLIATGEATGLLSTPTHSGGWIDPRVLAKKVNAWKGDDPLSRDVILAMLRLAPENRSVALKLLKERATEWFRAIQYALGANRTKIGGDAAIWVAAARARKPWHDDSEVMKKHPGLGPDAAEAAKLKLTSQVRKSRSFTFCNAGFEIEPAIPKSIDPLLVTVAMYSAQSIGRELSFEMGGFAGRTNGAVRWTATIWPQARESYFASSIVNCFSNLDWWEAEWQNRLMLEPLIDSGTPLRCSGLLFLVGMLAAKEPGESGLACDIAIRAIEDGRLGSDNLGEALARLLATGLIKPGRWQKNLAEIARISKIHASVIQLALQCCFENPKLQLPKDSAKLLELLYELSLELGVTVTSEACRGWLSSGAATGKSAKLAKSLLALAESPQSNESLRTILEQAVVQRTIAASKRSS